MKKEGIIGIIFVIIFIGLLLIWVINNNDIVEKQKERLEIDNMMCQEAVKGIAINSGSGQRLRCRDQEGIVSWVYYRYNETIKDYQITGIERMGVI